MSYFEMMVRITICIEVEWYCLCYLPTQSEVRWDQVSYKTYKKHSSSISKSMYFCWCLRLFILIIMYMHIDVQNNFIVTNQQKIEIRTLLFVLDIYEYQINLVTHLVRTNYYSKLDYV